MIKKRHTPTTLDKYYKRLKAMNAPESCRKEAVIEMPTLRLFVEEDCREAFKVINSQKHKEDLKNIGLQYILKVDIHWGKGITLLFDDNIAKLNQWYTNGQQCGKNQSQIVMQRYL